GQAEQENEPGDLNFGAAESERSRGERQRHDPECTGKLHGSGGDQGISSVPRSRSNHGASVMNGKRGQKAKWRLRKMEFRPKGRKNEKRDGVKNEDSPERNRHLLVVSLENRADGGDGAAAANRRTRGDEVRGGATDRK